MGTALIVGVVAATTASKIAAGSDVATATVEGFKPGFLVGAACSIGILVIGILLGGKKQQAQQPSDQAPVATR